MTARHALGITDQDIGEFCRLVAQGFEATLAGRQIGIGPSESQRLAKERRRTISQMQYRDSAKPRPLPGQAKRRRCLSCSETFISTHKGNRVCDTCKRSPDWRGGIDHSVAI